MHTSSVDDPTQEWTFDKEEIRLGSMDDNDVVLADDTVSRYHCKIVQEDSGWPSWSTTRSTNGTFINKVRVREAYLEARLDCPAGQSPAGGLTHARRKFRSSCRAPIAAAA